MKIISLNKHDETLAVRNNVAVLKLARDGEYGLYVCARTRITYDELIDSRRWFITDITAAKHHTPHGRTDYLYAPDLAFARHWCGFDETDLDDLRWVYAEFLPKYIHS